MSKFKIEDFKVGDKVTITGIVEANDMSRLPLLIKFQTGDTEWFRLDDIETHERSFKVGDRVKDATLSNEPEYTVIGVDGENLWLKGDDGYNHCNDAEDYEIVA